MSIFCYHQQQSTHNWGYEKDLHTTDSRDKAYNSNSYIDLCQDNIDFNTDMTINAGEMTSIINDLSCNKSPGLDGVTAEHMKYADSQLLVLLSPLCPLSWCMGIYQKK